MKEKIIKTREDVEKMNSSEICKIMQKDRRYAIMRDDSGNIDKIIQTETKIKKMTINVFADLYNSVVYNGQNKSFKYKKWFCEWDEVTQEFSCYTPDEMEQPRGFRQAEMECSTPDQCKEFINSYNIC